MRGRGVYFRPPGNGEGRQELLCGVLFLGVFYACGVPADAAGFQAHDPGADPNAGRLGSQRGDCAVLHNYGVFLRSGEGGLDLRLFADNLRGANRVRGAESGPGRAQFRGIRGDNRSGVCDVQI